MMQGFGVHTFRLVNADGESRFVKFHWNPVAGTHSLDWDEAVKISGADPDFHRRDLWEAIEAGAYPGVGARRADLHRAAGRAIQLRRARRDQDRPRGARAASTPVGTHGAQPQSRQLLRRDRAGRVLHRAHRARASTSPTIRCSPGASTRTSTRRSRGSAAPTSTRSRSTRRRAGAQQPARRHAPAGDHARPRRLRAELARRRLPVPGRRGAASPRSRSRSQDDKVRGKPEKFADHYTQATLFWNSQTPVEQAHIVARASASS